MREFNCRNCGKCCGPIPVTRQQLGKIRRALKEKTKDELDRLATQNREPYTCPLLDIEHKRCSVYESRPEICKMFGFYKGMVCASNKTFATGTAESGRKRLEDANKGDVIGILGIDLTWSNGLYENPELINS